MLAPAILIPLMSSRVNIKCSPPIPWAMFKDYRAQSREMERERALPFVDSRFEPCLAEPFKSVPESKCPRHSLHPLAKGVAMETEKRVRQLDIVHITGPRGTRGDEEEYFV